MGSRLRVETICMILGRRTKAGLHFQSLSVAAVRRTSNIAASAPDACEIVPNLVLNLVVPPMCWMLNRLHSVVRHFPPRSFVIMSAASDLINPKLFVFSAAARCTSFASV